MAKYRLLFLMSFLFVAACGGGGGGGEGPTTPPVTQPPQPTTVTLEGVVEKGPFAAGSSVAIHSLTAGGQRDQVLADLTTTDSLGSFSDEVDENQNVEIEAIGQFYSELDGTTTTNSLVLGAIIRVGSAGTQDANVNLLSHLAVPRHRALIADSAVTDSAAATQARTDVMNALGDILSPPSMSSFHSASLYSGASSNESSAYLVALSSMFSLRAQALAAQRGTDHTTEMQALLDGVADDLRDGVLDDQLGAGLIRETSYRLDPVAVLANLGDLATAEGSSLVPGDISLFLDSDLDGIVNNDDPDDDNDGIADGTDAYPVDWSCFQAADGDGTRCQVEAALPAFYQATQIVRDNDDVLYLLDSNNSQIVRWSMGRQQYGAPIAVQAGSTSITYSPTHDLLYVGNNAGAIISIERSGPHAVSLFATAPAGITDLVPAGDHLLALTGNDGYTYDIGGTLADQRFLRTRAGTASWDDINDRVIFLGPFSPRDVEYIEVDPLNGTFGGAGNTPYHGDLAMSAPARVSSEHARIVTGAGDILDGTTLDLHRSLPGPYTDFAWRTGDELASIRNDNGDARVAVHDESGAETEYGKFTGTPLRVFEHGDRIQAIVQVDRPEFREFFAGGDFDDDAVPNTADAFPTDPAASTDSDFDGHPDSWNDGMTEADSTTGLVIDLYPSDSICYLPGHGDGTTCDIAGNIPSYTPDYVVADSRGAVYLFSISHERIYRWDPAAGHLNPITLSPGKSPAHLRYSPDEDRIYVAYGTGEISFWDAANPGSEQYFTSTPTYPTGIQPAGNFLWASGSGAQTSGRHTLSFAADGTLASYGDFRSEASRHTAWNPVLERVYLFRDGISPGDINYQDVDQQTGALGSVVDSPYHGDYSITPPIRVSLDGTLIMLGSGDVYDATNLNWLGSIAGGFADSLWIDQNATLVASDNSGDTQLLRRDSNGEIVEVANYSGAPVALLRNGGEFTVVSQTSTPQFYSFASSDDSDGDGVLNSVDDFPLDPAASVDSDGDGYPDSWNAGMTEADSTTGLTLDAYPNDAACYLPGHGDGVICDITSTMPNYVPASMALEDSGILYLFSPENQRIFRRDVVTGDHLNPFIVGGSTWLDPVTPTLMTYHEAHDRLYIAYDSGEINYIDLSTGDTETWFATAPGRIGGMADVGNFLLVQDDTGAWNTHHIFDVSGSIRTSVEWNRYSREYAWNETLNRVYFFRDGTSPNDLHYEEIDQATGLITDDGETPYHGDYPMLTPIRISEDDASVLIGGGDIFDAVDMTWQGAITGGFVDARWNDDGGIVTVSDNGGSSAVARRDSNGNVVDGATLAGPPLALYKFGAEFVVVINQGIPEIVSYVPSNDSDNDGVANDVDAFPTDPAASIDSDGDGYPDAWNPGMTEADSTSGLELDAYPDDAACYLPEHGDGVTCDITSTMPNYVPTSVAMDTAGVVYLFSPENSKVFRWDSTTEQHLNPLVVGTTDWLGSESPTRMAYHSGHGRLYFGYASGTINYIDTAGGTDEALLTTLAGPVATLADAGNYLVAQGSTGSSNALQLFATDGSPVSSSNVFGATSAFAWDDTLDRIYYQLGNNGGAVAYQEINQANGQFGTLNSVSNSSLFGFGTPTRVSPDGTRVIAGSGNTFDTSDMSWQTRIGGGFHDMQWVDSTSLVSMVSTGGGTRVDRTGLANERLERLSLTGEPIAVLSAGGSFVVVTDQGIPAFTVYIPSDDTDGDGIPNTLDAFPDDVAASEDSDGDGFPDAWNTGMSQGDSTTGLTLDAYPNDSACTLLAHGDGVNCDVAGQIGSYTPDKIVTDANGIIYLLSNTTNRIYRWDPATGHLNPLLLDDESTDGIINLTISPVANRLYASYQSGRLTYRDLADPSAEVNFASIPTPANGLQAAGSYLWTGARNAATTGRYNVIFDHAGAIAQFSTFGSYVSVESAWNDTLDRVYHFRDGLSPNDILYQSVDQATGQVSGAVDSPYHGDYSIRAPIRLSPNDDKVLLGSGDIYNASDLVYLGSIAGPLADAQWVDNDSIVAVYDNAGSSQVVRRDDTGSIVEIANFAGSPLAITPAPGGFTVVADQGGPVFYSYIPSDDSDGDGVSNTADAFPLDAAASVDTDGDGYPDAWNTGMTEADSTTGLTLDAYPNDSACFLPGHGDGVTCDISSTIPSYMPNYTVMDGSGVVYLFSATHNRVFRWDSVTQEHLNPILVGSDAWLQAETPSIMTYHDSHFRLYFGYTDGDITYVDLLALDGEQHLATLPESVNGLADVGNFLLAQDNSGAWESHHIIDAAGIFRESREWNQYSSAYDWNATLSRVYFFRDTQSPNDLLYEEIDQVSGLITDAGDSPYHGTYSIQPPIRVSVDDSQVVLGSGDVYDASSLTWIGNYPNPFVDGEWLADGRLVTIRANGSDTALEVLNTSFGVDSASVISSSPSSLFLNGTDVVVVTQGAQPEFTVVTP